MAMEKHGVCDNEGEEPKPEKQAQAPKGPCGCPVHDPNSPYNQATGQDTLSKLADAAKDASSK